MNRELLYALFVIILALSSCEDVVNSTFTCQETGEYLGEFKITDEANTFWMYEPNQKRIYVDSIGNEIVFYEQQAYTESIEEVNIRTVCAHPNWMQSEYDFGDFEQKYVQYFSNDGNHYMWLNLSSSAVNITDSSETVLDVFFIGTSRSYYSFAASDRGNPEDVPDFYKIEYLETLSEATFLGKTFNDLYYDNINELPTYFNKSEGVVAFYDWNGTLYVLDRIE